MAAKRIVVAGGSGFLGKTTLSITSPAFIANIPGSTDVEAI
jgi:MinD superfamily P-loop ATPase